MIAYETLPKRIQQTTREFKEQTKKSECQERMTKKKTAMKQDYYITQKFQLNDV